MSGEAERARAIHLEQEAEEATCPGCEHRHDPDGHCDAWWVQAGTADVEVSCGCPRFPTEEELEEVLREAPAAPVRFHLDPWTQQGPVPPPPF